MDVDKSFVSSSIPLLVMELLEDGDLYGYQMIEKRRRRSDDTFHLKAGTLYPLLHGLEKRGASLPMSRQLQMENPDAIII